MSTLTVSNGPTTNLLCLDKIYEKKEKKRGGGVYLVSISVSAEAPAAASCLSEAGRLLAVRIRAGVSCQAFTVRTQPCFLPAPGRSLGSDLPWREKQSQLSLVFLALPACTDLALKNFSANPCFNLFFFFLSFPLLLSVPSLCWNTKSGCSSTWRGDEGGHVQ